MPTTPNLALPYPAATAAPDVPGDVFALANSLDGILGGGIWVPALGGGFGAAIGANPATGGRFLAIGKHVTAKGYIAFGAGASFGTGTATLTGLPVTMNTDLSNGYGWYQNGGTLIPVHFTPLDGANLAIRPVVSNGTSVALLGTGPNIGTPPQSSVLRFALDLVSA